MSIFCDHFVAAVQLGLAPVITFDHPFIMCLYCVLSACKLNEDYYCMAMNIIAYL